MSTNMSKKPLVAILLPLTSKDVDDFADVEVKLQNFHETCVKNAGNNVSFSIYLGIDYRDILLDTDDKPAENYLRRLGCARVQTVMFEPVEPAAICKMWIELAQQAYESNCDYYVLLGDDVTIECETWFDKVETEFESIRTQLPSVPHGFGCVALLDTGAPGFPSFPIIGRVHMDIFMGEIIPSNQFINQDGDPFLFHLYTPFGATRIAKEVLLTNGVGGFQHLNRAYNLPRYDRVFVLWKKLLKPEIRKISEYFTPPIPQKILLDVVVPSFRAERVLLEGILNIIVPFEDCATRFIIVIDNPDLDIEWLRGLQRERCDKILVLENAKNMGASHSRNVGIKESSADWILFLDDDVKPREDILVKYVEAIKTHGDDYDAFVGPTILPEDILPEDGRYYATAVLLSGVSFFWTYALESDEMPWGITANLLVRNYAKESEPLLFDTEFIKTGGGEDIDYCLRLFKRSSESKKKALKCVPGAVAEHPWWSNGKREYKHFYNWAVGDSRLISMHSEHTFRTPPNIVECSVFMTFLALVHCLYSQMLRPLWTLLIILALFFTLDTAFECYPVFNGEENNKYRILRNTCKSHYYLYPFILVDMNIVRICSEIGHFAGPMSFPRYRICYRFDWFCGKHLGYSSKYQRRDTFRSIVFVFDWFCGKHLGYRSKCQRRDTFRFIVFVMLSLFVYTYLV